MTADRKTHQKTHDELTALKNWMQHHYQEEANLELEILQRVRGDVDRLLVYRKDRRRHPGNEKEYHRERQMSEQQNRNRGAIGASDHESETRDKRRESESQERQEYTREREEELENQQSGDYSLPMPEFDPPTQLASLPQEGGTKAKTKMSVQDYRSMRLQQEATREKEERDWELERQQREEMRRQKEEIEFQKQELARQHEIEIQQAEIARIKYGQEQLRLEQERLQKEQEANAKLLASQVQHTPVTFDSHTPVYDENGQELDYHDDIPVTSDSQEVKSWEEFFCQQGCDTNPCSLQDVSGGAASLEEEARILQGPTMKSTASEEAILLRDEETPTVDMRQFLAGLETLTPTMLSELSTHIEHLRQRASPLASTNLPPKKSPPAPPPGLPTMPTVANPMQQALLEVTSNLGTSPTHQRTPTRPPGEEETTRAAAILVEQMNVKVPGMALRKHDRP